jgi:hypothetical protein
MAWMGRYPTPQELNLQFQAKKANSQEDEKKDSAEKLAYETARQQWREKLATALKAYVMTVNTDHLSAGVKEKLAGEFAKKYGDLPDVRVLFGKDPKLSDETVKKMAKVIFTKAADLRMASAKKADEVDQFAVNVAKDYAKLADIIGQELDTAVRDLGKQQPASQSKPHAPKVYADRSDPHFGEIKPGTVAKKDGQNDKGQKKPSKSERKKARQQQGSK